MTPVSILYFVGKLIDMEYTYIKGRSKKYKGSFEQLELLIWCVCLKQNKEKKKVNYVHIYSSTSLKKKEQKQMYQLTDKLGVDKWKTFSFYTNEVHKWTSYLDNYSICANGEV